MKPGSSSPLAASLAQQAHRELLAQLLAGRLLPGQLLNRRQLAVDLDMSVAPVLEACLQLEHEGFLETLPRKGTRVRLFSPAEVRGRLLLREAVECQAARLYCGTPVRRLLPELNPLAQAADDRALSPPQLWQAEVAFHRALVTLAQCPELLTALNQVLCHSLFFAVNTLAPQAKQAVPRYLHRHLLQALCTRGPDLAERAMRDHLRRGKDGLFTHLGGP